MKVCDKCRKPMTKPNHCFGSELCETCAAKIKEWIKKPSSHGIVDQIFGGNQ